MNCALRSFFFHGVKMLPQLLGKKANQKETHLHGQLLYTKPLSHRVAGVSLMVQSGSLKKEGA